MKNANEQKDDFKAGDLVRFQSRKILMHGPSAFIFDEATENWLVPEQFIGEMHGIILICHFDFGRYYSEKPYVVFSNNRTFLVFGKYAALEKLEP